MRRYIVALTVLFSITQVFGAMLGAGTRELMVAGNLSSDGDLVVGAGYGYFLMDCLEVGVNGTIMSANDVTAYGVAAFTEYNVEIGGPLVPFVGAGAGFMITDDNNLFRLTALGGVKYFLVDNLALSCYGQFQYASEDIFLRDDEPQSSDFGIAADTRFYF